MFKHFSKIFFIFILYGLSDKVQCESKDFKLIYVNYNQVPNIATNRFYLPPFSDLPSDPKLYKNYDYDIDLKPPEVSEIPPKLSKIPIVQSTIFGDKICESGSIYIYGNCRPEE